MKEEKKLGVEVIFAREKYFNPLITQEVEWLEAFFKHHVFTWVSIFHQLEEVYEQIVISPETYEQQINEVRNRIKLDFEDILIVNSIKQWETRSEVFSWAFRPGDPDYGMVKRKYNRQCKKLGIGEVRIPFNVFWAIGPNILTGASRETRAKIISGEVGIFRLSNPIELVRGESKTKSE